MVRLIDADVLMNELLKWNTEAVRTDNHINTIFSSGMIGIVRLSPTVDAVPVRHGRWIKGFEDADGQWMRCSECQMVFYVGKGRDGNYCPNCGARMDEK